MTHPDSKRALVQALLMEGLSTRVVASRADIPTSTVQHWRKDWGLELVRDQEGEIQSRLRGIALRSLDLAERALDATEEEGVKGKDFSRLVIGAAVMVDKLTKIAELNAKTVQVENQAEFAQKVVEIAMKARALQDAEDAAIPGEYRQK